MMKTFLSFLLLLAGSHIIAQNYILDDTFGTDGTKYYPGLSIRPSKGIALNGHYFFIDGDKIIKVNYDGSFATNFGTGGVKTLPSDTYANGIKIYNNWIYILGYTNVGAMQNAFMIKFDENGNYDTTFGNNGKALINFGFRETISDFVMESSGKLYFTGSQLSTSSPYAIKLIYFKVNTNGSIDTSFDSNGYKSFLVNAATGGSVIAPYQDGFLIAGENKIDASFNTSHMMLIKVDTNGNLDNSFGTNGYKIGGYMEGYAGIDSSGSNQLYGDKFYVTNMWANGFGFRTGGMVIYDVLSNQRVNPTGPYHDNYFDVSSDGLFVTGYNYLNCAAAFPYCQNSFNLRKMTMDGSGLDPNFQNNSVYNYSFPGVQSDCESQVFIKDSDGKVLIAGYSAVSATPSWVGFSMIRLKEGVLAVNNPNAAPVLSVSPNPFDQKLILTTDAAVKNIEVFDLPGRKIGEPRFETFDKNIEVDLSAFTQKGTYLLRITTAENKTYTRKIIKK